MPQKYILKLYVVGSSPASAVGVEKFTRDHCPGINNRLSIRGDRREKASAVGGRR